LKINDEESSETTALLRAQQNNSRERPNAKRTENKTDVQHPKRSPSTETERVNN
jgi:hypothetical protein